MNAHTETTDIYGNVLGWDGIEIATVAFTERKYYSRKCNICKDSIESGWDALIYLKVIDGQVKKTRLHEDCATDYINSLIDIEEKNQQLREELQESYEETDKEFEYRTGTNIEELEMGLAE